MATYQLRGHRLYNLSGEKAGQDYLLFSIGAETFKGRHHLIYHWFVEEIGNQADVDEASINDTAMIMVFASRDGGRPDETTSSAALTEVIGNGYKTTMMVSHVKGSTVKFVRLDVHKPRGMKILTFKMTGNAVKSDTHYTRYGHTVRIASQTIWGDPWKLPRSVKFNGLT